MRLLVQGPVTAQLLLLTTDSTACAATQSQPHSLTQVLPPDDVQRTQRMVQLLLRHQLPGCEALLQHCARGAERLAGAREVV